MIRLVSAIVVLISAIALAQAGFFAGGTTSSKCLYLATQAVDGCSGAPTANALTVQHANFFTSYALQSGQTWPSTAGNTGAGNPGLLAPHPAYNVAGVDYPVGPAAGSSNPGDATYDRNLDPTSPGYGLKLMTAKNFANDGMSTLCTFNSGTGRISCVGTMPNNARCPTTGRGNNCVIFDGYDFTNHGAGGSTSTANDGSWFSFTTSLIATQIVIKNSYLAPAALSYSQTKQFTFGSASTVTIANNKIDSKNDLTSLLNGTGWGANNSQMNVFFSFNVTANTLTDNADCGAYSVAYCIQYNAFINSAGRMVSFNHADCTSACDGFVSQFNYHEMGNNLQWKLTGWIDDGSVAGGYSGVAGKCFVVTAINAGTTFTTATAPTGAEILTSYTSGGTAAFNLKANKYFPTTTACNNSASPIGLSFLIAPSPTVTPPVPVPPGTTIYMNNGIHGDPYFVSFTASSFGTPLPVVAGQWTNQYNVTLFPKDSWSATGMSTQNTTNGPFIKTATLNNCTPNCSTGTAGNTLNVTSVTLNGNLFPTANAAWPSLTFTGGSATVTLGTGNLPTGADVRLSCSSLPTGFSASTDYFVVNPGAGTIQLAATAGGAAITPSSSGSACRIQGNIYTNYLLPGSDNPTYTSPFPAGGVTVTGSALTGATCDNGPCTGTGTNGAYLVSYAGGATTASYNNTSGLEMSGVSVTSFNENHNLYISNLSPSLNAQSLGPFSAVIGNNHAINYGSLNISNVFYDPSGGFSCINPGYNNAPSPSVTANNVNLLGNGSGQWDTNSNSKLGCYGLAP